MKKNCLSLLAAVGLFVSATTFGQTGIYVVTNTPDIGPNDFSQLENSAAYPGPGEPDGLNYFANNGVDNSELAGQTFTTGGNATGYTITKLCIYTAGGPANGGIYNQLQPYVLNIYAIANGTNGTLIQSYTSQKVTFNAGQYGTGVWLQWTNLAVPLAANTTYAYGFSRTIPGAGFFGLGWRGGDTFSGGEMCLIPWAGGRITVGSSHGYDGTFIINLSLGSTTQAPTFGSQPTPEQLLAGRTAKFSAFCAGTAPLSYRWLKNGVPLSDGGSISGSLTNTLMLGNVSAADVAGYSLVVSNAVGVSTSSVAGLKLAATPAPGSYADKVLSYNPVAYWRLNDTTSSPVTNGPVNDLLGIANGFYGNQLLNAFNNVAGMRPPAFPGMESNNFCLRTINSQYFAQVPVGALNLKTNAVTITAWIKPVTNQLDFTGLFTWRLYQDCAGLGFSTNNQLGYTWNTNAQATWSYGSGLYVPTNIWSLVALAVSPSRASLYVINANGINAATNVMAHSKEDFSSLCYIANDPASDQRIYNGFMDEVAVFNSTFTPDQLLSLYAAATNTPAVAVSLSIGITNSSVVVSWPQGTLLEATDLTGPWQTNNANSPYTVPAGTVRKFYRVRVQ